MDIFEFVCSFSKQYSDYIILIKGLKLWNGVETDDKISYEKNGQGDYRPG